MNKFRNTYHAMKTSSDDHLKMIIEMFTDEPKNIGYKVAKYILTQRGAI